ncbi:hypothetical protein EJF36_07940 [Bacillus sp. HMF5848]|uniref:MotA/TolQ/ExbB proton channel family protein n=1 Tax=Bacillus sp. HMF5848 TaxID=2495421 RepID=UPI000F798ABD|nr:MotA/TolQ/ExbB proton channel family protein [Bacillus sp. HMF5848]RSK26798.1 hypothetical protein EJF36_07940 [Bacillus sp. HMF5848]
MTFLPDDITSVVIISATFLVLLYITFRAIRTNHAIYTFFYNVSQDLSRSPEQHSFVQVIFNKFQSVKNKDIHLQSFLEEYFAEYRLEAHKAKVLQELKMIQMWSSIAILIGVLGTFIGLVVSLSGIDTAMMNDSITNVLSGIHTAFYTSIAGIICSIFINVRSKYENAEQMMIEVMLKLENYLREQERETTETRMVESMGDMKHAILELNETFKNTKTFHESFERATEKMLTFSDAFGKNAEQFQVMFSNMNNVTDSYNDQMVRLSQDFSSLFSFMEKQETVQQQALKIMDETSNHVVGFVEKQSTIADNQYKEYKQLSVTYQSIRDDITESLQAAKVFYEASLQKQSEVWQSQQAFEEKNHQLLKQVEQATSSIKQVLDTTSFSHLTSFAKTFQINMEQLQENFRDMIGQFDRTEQLQKQYKELYEQVLQQTEQHTIRQTQQQKAFLSQIDSVINHANDMHDSYKKTYQLITSFDTASSILTDELKKLLDRTERTMQENLIFMKEQSGEVQTALRQFLNRSTDFTEKIMMSIDTKLDSTLYDNLNKMTRQVEAVVNTLDSTMQNFTDTTKQASAQSNKLLQTSLEDLSDTLRDLSRSRRAQIPNS